MMSLPSEKSEWIVAFVLLAVILGGAAALSAGRALALGWRSFWRAPLFMVGLAAGVGFLHYALFGLSAIPIYTIGAAIWSLRSEPGPALARLAGACAYWAALCLLLTGFAFVGYRGARRRQMYERYGWLFESAGWLAWREKPHGASGEPPGVTL